MSSNHAIYEIISETLGVPVADLLPETALRSLPNTESMKVLTIILKVEKRFDIEVPDVATFRLETIGEFEALVESLRAEAAAHKAAPATTLITESVA